MRCEMTSPQSDHCSAGKQFLFILEFFFINDIFKQLIVIQNVKNSHFMGLTLQKDVLELGE